MSKRKQDRPIDTRPPIAISYARFSTPEQASGDSLRRQTEDTDKWCQRNGIPLDSVLTLTDRGRSAYHGKHLDDKAALGQFLEMVKQGRIPHGSFLIIEYLDRLTREEVWDALDLVSNLTRNGVRIVQLHPVEQVIDRTSGPMVVMMMIIELMRGNSESEAKSTRTKANWQKRYELARLNGELLTAWLPAWMRTSEDGRPELIEERAATVRTIFKLAATGYGHGSIARRLREDGIEAFGPTGSWSAEYVGRILKDRRALGELQPRTGPDRKPIGEPIKGYYPAVVREEEWCGARAAVDGRRKKKQGRMGNDGVANLFGGMLRNARDGGTYLSCPRMNSGSPVRVIMASSFRSQKGPCWSFPLDTFERCLLAGLSEVKPEDVLPVSQPDSANVLQNELTWLRERLDTLRAELLREKKVKAVVDVIAQLETRETEILDALEKTADQAVKPLADSWKDIRTLTDLLDEAEEKEDVRIRLRAAIRRVVDEVWVLVTKIGRDQLASVQVFFRTDNTDQTNIKNEYRSYLLIHRPGRGNKSVRIPARYAYLTIGQPEGMEAGLPMEVHDLRRWHTEETFGAEDVLRGLECYPREMIDRILDESGVEIK